MQNGLLLLGVSAVDDGGLLTLRSQNLGGFLTFRGQNLCTLVTLGLHLLLHGVQHGCGRNNVLQLYAVHLHTPLVGGVVQHGAQLGIDGVARGQRLVQLQLTDDVTQRCLCQLLDGVGQV